MTKLARHLKNFYGGANFVRIVKDLQSGVSVSTIAAYANVSRQRVYQWREKLGKEVTVWQPNEEIMEYVAAHNFFTK